MKLISALLLIFSITLLSWQDIACAKDKSTNSVKITILGDSLTAGYGLEEKHSLPSQLEKALQAENINLSINNAGVSGDTTAGGLERLTWTLTEPTDILVIALGGNDGLRGIDPTFTKQNLENIILQARDLKPDLKIWLLGMLAPPNLGKKYSKEFNAIYPYLEEKYNTPLYPFLLDGVVMDKRLNQADGIHPNVEGIKVIVTNLTPFFKDNIDVLREED